MRMYWDEREGESDTNEMHPGIIRNSIQDCLACGQETTCTWTGGKLTSEQTCERGGNVFTGPWPGFHFDPSSSWSADQAAPATFRRRRQSLPGPGSRGMVTACFP